MLSYMRKQKTKTYTISHSDIPNRSPKKDPLLTNLTKNGILLCINEEVKSSIAILALYTFMLLIFFIKKDSITKYFIGSGPMFFVNNS